MENFTQQQLQTAQKSIASTIRKNEKVYQTLSHKQIPRPSQMNMVSKNIKNLYLMLELVENKLKGECSVNISKESLKDLLNSMPMYIQQIEKIKPKSKEGTPQFTLAVRRIEAYHITLTLIKENLSL